MANRTIYVRDDSLYERAQKKAENLGVTISAVIESALRDFISGDHQTPIEIAREIERLSFVLVNVLNRDVLKKG